MKKIMAILLSVVMLTSVFTGCGNSTQTPTDIKSDTGETVNNDGPVKIKIFYSDNATLPFKKDWLTVKTAEEKFNVDFDFEVIPIADYKTKVSLALNTGTNTPDVILYQSTVGENASLALNGAIVPISDYADWTPNFNAKVKEFGMEEDIAKLNLADGKRYYMPGLFDVPFYDGGLIMREDFLQKNNLPAPKTYDDLYKILKEYKKQNPDSYPLTILAGPRVLFRMTMPAFGVSLGKNGTSGNTLSYNYEKGEYFAGAISDEYKAYVSFLAKLYAEGLLDPEMADPINGDIWSQKMATGKAMASYAYYDQIGGIEGASTIDGFKLQMYPALAGPAGAHHQPKSRTGAGIMFPTANSKRKDFERVVRTIDEVFFSDEGAKLWCLGVEGVTYTEKDGKITYSDEIMNAKEGIYKSMQVKYGCGSDVTQLVWINKREMSKYDENYARINAEVEAMGNVIQPIPPAPAFDDLASEEAGILQTPLADTFEVWVDAFITGKKSVEKDWDQYVAEMKNLRIDDFCKLYNDNLKK